MKAAAKWYLPLLSLVIAASVAAFAADKAPSTQPSDDTKDAKTTTASKAKWGVAPWNQLSGMTDEQKMKINEIHKKSLADQKVIEDKETADIMALLTDEQKVELDKMKAEKKAKAAEKRKAAKEAAKDEDKDKTDATGDKDKQ